MVTVWWSSAGLIHHNFIKPGKIITVEKYCRKNNEMHQKFTHKQLALVNSKHPILLYVNARPHISMITRQKLQTLSYEILDHPPCSPDLSLTDFLFLKHLYNFLQEKCFRNPKDAEMAFNDFVASTMTTFYDTGIKEICFSLAKVY